MQPNDSQSVLMTLDKICNHMKKEKRELINVVLDMAKTGCSYRDIQKVTGFCEKTTKKILADEKVDINPKFYGPKRKRMYICEYATNEWLIEEYVNKGRCASDIANELSEKLGFKVYNSLVIQICKDYGITTRSIKETSTISNKKRKDTFIARYGVDSPFKMDSVKKKVNETMIERYGTDNPMKIEKVRQKARSTMLQKYGVEYTIQMEGFQASNGKRSKLQIIVENYLNERGIIFESEKRNVFAKYDQDKQRVYTPIPDIYIENVHIVIEVYGEDIHADPRKYKADENIKTWCGILPAKEIWLRDEMRKKHMESFGFTVIEIWQREIRNGSYRKILDERLGNFYTQK